MKTLKGIIIVLIAGIVTAGSISRLFAEEQPSTVPLDERLAHKVTIADLVSYAYMNNPSILAAKEAWKATVEKYRLEAGYPDLNSRRPIFPNPSRLGLAPRIGI